MDLVLAPQSGPGPVQSIAPIQAQDAQHGHLHPDAQAHSAIEHLPGIILDCGPELGEAHPGVAGIGEGQHIDAGAEAVLDLDIVDPHGPTPLAVQPPVGIAAHPVVPDAAHIEIFVYRNAGGIGIAVHHPQLGAEHAHELPEQRMVEAVFAEVLLVIDLAAQEAAGELGADHASGALRGIEGTVPAVAHQGQPGGGRNPGPLLVLHVFGVEGGHIIDIDPLQGIGPVGTGVVQKRHRPTQLEAEPGALLIVVAVIIGGVVEVQAHGGGGVEKPGLGEAGLDVELPLAELGLDVGRLALAHDIGPADLDESSQAVHRTVGGAYLKLADALLLDLEDEIDVAQGVAGKVVELHVLEIAQGEHLPLAADDGRTPKELAGLDHQLPPDHLVPGLGVALDQHPVDVGLVVLGDLVLNIGCAVHQVFAGHDMTIDVALLGVNRVEVLQGLVGIVDPVDGPRLQLADPLQPLRGKLLVAHEIHLAHPVALALLHRQVNHHPVLGGGVGDGIQGHRGLQIAVVLVEPDGPFQIGPQGILVESALAEPGYHLEHRAPAPGLGLHGFDDGPVAEGLVAVDLQRLHPDLLPFADDKTYGVLLARFDQSIPHLDIDIALVQIAVPNPVAGAGHRPHIQKRLGLDRDAVQYLLGLDLGVAQHLHPGHAGLLLDVEDDGHAVFGTVDMDRDVLEIAQAVDPLHRLRYQGRRIFIPGQQLGAVENDVIVHPAVS